MNVTQPFFHHCDIDVSRSSVRMRRTTCKMQKIQGTIHIPERQQSEQNVDEPLKRLNETDSKGKKKLDM
jgi:hypothetical protein